MRASQRQQREGTWPSGACNRNFARRTHICPSLRDRTPKSPRPSVPFSLPPPGKFAKQSDVNVPRGEPYFLRAQVSQSRGADSPLHSVFASPWLLANVLGQTCEFAASVKCGLSSDTRPHSQEKQNNTPFSTFTWPVSSFGNCMLH